MEMNINSQLNNSTKANIDINLSTSSSEHFSDSQTSQDSFKSYVQGMGESKKMDKKENVKIYLLEQIYSNMLVCNPVGFEMRTDFNFDTLNVSKEDAEFFVNCLENKGISVSQCVNGEFSVDYIDETSNSSPAQGLSKTLIGLIEKSYKTNQPIRLDFDNNISVILKITKEGKLNAEFLPSSQAAEEYLRNNIGFLRNNLDSQNIEYDKILYKKHKNNKNNQNKGGKDE